MQPSRPKLFIGSSREAKRYATAVQRELKRYAEVTPWFAGVFKPNNATMDDLEYQLEISDFAVFVFSPDDIVELRGKLMLSPRDNVIFELGLFWGKLRRDRVFFLVPESAFRAYGGKEIADFHIPSDLHGLTWLTYEQRSDDNYDAAVNPACDTVSEKIEKLGKYRTPFHDSLLHFFIQFSKDIMKEPAKKYEVLYEALRNSFSTSVTGQRVSGAAVWKVEGSEGIRQVAGNVGRGRFYPFTVNDGKVEGDPRILVVDAFLTSTQQCILYKKHVANVYLLCYPVGKELVITVHLSGKQAFAQELERLMDDNEPLLDTIHYLFGGDSI